MGLDLDYIDGQTPLAEDEINGLLISTITNRKELDEFEQQNIERAIQWTFGKKFNQSKILTENFVLDIHKRMYNQVWSWAGKYRKTNKNLGTDRWQIPIELKILLDDTSYWIDNKTYSPDEIAIRFKHKIVSINCFSNGNVRHSRLMADIIIEKIYKLPVFSWGADILSNDIESRKYYLNAVKAADNGDFILLLNFARS